MRCALAIALLAASLLTGCQSRPVNNLTIVNASNESAGFIDVRFLQQGWGHGLSDLAGGDSHEYETTHPLHGLIEITLHSEGREQVFLYLRGEPTQQLTFYVLDREGQRIVRTSDAIYQWDAEPAGLGSQLTLEDRRRLSD